MSLQQGHRAGVRYRSSRSAGARFNRCALGLVLILAWLSPISCAAGDAALAAELAQDRPNAEPDSVPAASADPSAEDRRWIRTSSGNSVYFAYGSAQLTDSARALIEHHAERLLAKPRLTVTLAGYTDDFSSSSYSIALGEQRAQVVRNLLLSLKVSPVQVRVTSYGHEKFPTDPCQTEMCRTSYRRVEFRYAADAQRR